MFKTYLLLTKPGIVLANLLATIGGFLLASRGIIDPGVFVASATGLTFVIASGCVFNNYIDRRIDGKMERTKQRALVKKIISSQNALLFGGTLGIVGFFMLAFYTNFLAFSIALLGFVFYVVLYGYWKRHSTYGTLVGSVAGAVPPVVGYTAASGTLDVGSILLFLILVCWQMPHFYAIALFRLKEYRAASLPVLPVKKGILLTKKHILFYVVCYVLILHLLTVFGYTGLIYLFVMIPLSLYWLYISIRGFGSGDDAVWARRLFRFSLVTLTVFSVMISLESLLPF